MTQLLIVAIAGASVALGLLAALHARDRRRGRPAGAGSSRRILFPFTPRALSQPALDAALRLARAEHATLAPVFLARVPLHLPLDTPLPRQCRMAVPLLEAIEQRAAAYGVPVDARIERGRDQRHALSETLAHEPFDRIVVAAAPRGTDGFHAEDVAWLIDHTPGELVVLRPARDERIEVQGEPEVAPVEPRSELALR
jgi:hypothetical protein